MTGSRARRLGTWTVATALAAVVALGVWGLAQPGPGSPLPTTPITLPLTSAPSGSPRTMGPTAKEAIDKMTILGRVLPNDPRTVTLSIRGPEDPPRHYVIEVAGHLVERLTRAGAFTRSFDAAVTPNVLVTADAGFSCAVLVDGVVMAHNAGPAATSCRYDPTAISEAAPGE